MPSAWSCITGRLTTNSVPAIRKLRAPAEPLDRTPPRPYSASCRLRGNQHPPACMNPRCLDCSNSPSLFPAFSSFCVLQNLHILVLSNPRTITLSFSPSLTLSNTRTLEYSFFKTLTPSISGTLKRSSSRSPLCIRSSNSRPLERAHAHTLKLSNQGSRQCTLSRSSRRRAAAARQR
jgi:hypothetical protein